MSRQPRAFTVVELLVVISIIVFLLALLAPAIDRAVYQAQLAICGAQLKGIASGVTVYVADYKRQYPNRPRLEAVPQWQNNKFFDPPGAGNVQGQDLRFIIRDHVATNAFLDPLVQRVDIAYPKATHGYMPYSIWFGWFFDGEKRMKKLGDRFTWAGDAFDLLVSDWDFANPGQNYASAHPDADDLMSNVVRDDQQLETRLVGVGTGVESGARFSLSSWEAIGVKRGAVDLKFGSADGSVARYDGVTYDEVERGKRMVQVPWSRNAQHNPSQIWTHLPKLGR